MLCLVVHAVSLLQLLLLHSSSLFFLCSSSSNNTTTSNRPALRHRHRKHGQTQLDLIKQEATTHKDILLIDAPDEDHGEPKHRSATTLKVMHSMRYAANNFVFEYFARVGDDAYFRVDFFAELVLLQKVYPQKNAYVGYKFANHVVPASDSTHSFIVGMGFFAVSRPGDVRVQVVSVSYSTASPKTPSSGRGLLGPTPKSSTSLGFMTLIISQPWRTLDVPMRVCCCTTCGTRKTGTRSTKRGCWNVEGDESKLCYKKVRVANETDFNLLLIAPF